MKHILDRQTDRQTQSHGKEGTNADYSNTQTVQHSTYTPSEPYRCVRVTAVFRPLPRALPHRLFARHHPPSLAASLPTALSESLPPRALLYLSLLKFTANFPLQKGRERRRKLQGN